jgi:hypothetical protein
MATRPKQQTFDIETLIGAAGGIDELRARMGLDARRGYNRICQWRARAKVPISVQVEHRRLFLRLAAKLLV